MDGGRRPCADASRVAHRGRRRSGGLYLRKQGDDHVRDRTDPIARDVSDTPGAVLLVLDAWSLVLASSCVLGPVRSAAFCSSTTSSSTRSRLMSRRSRTNRLM